MRVTRDCWVELEYELRDEDGQLVEVDDDEPVRYLHGHDEILPGLERALDGRESGDRFEVSLTPQDAFGPHDPEAIIAVPRSEFPPNAEIVPGDLIEIEVTLDEESGGDGEPESVEARVVEISPEAVVLDGNHPLAGRTLVCSGKLLSVMNATPDEIAERTSNPPD